MKVSVAVPARNEECTLGSCLTAIAAQSHAAHEVFVVNDGSTDNTGAIARSFAEHDPRFRVVDLTGIGPSAGRNRAIAAATGDVIAFTDADAIPEPDWLESLALALAAADARVVGVGGAQTIPADATAYERQVHEFLATFGFVSEYLRTNASAVPTNHNPTVNAMYRVDALRAIGGFREDLFPCEDLDLDRRLLARGGRLLFTPTARVAHHRPRTPDAFRRMMCSYGRGHARLIRIHGPYRLLHALPLAVGATALSAAVIPLPFFALALPVGALAFTALAAKVGTPRRAAHFSAMLAIAVFEWHRGFAGELAKSARG